MLPRSFPERRPGGAAVPGPRHSHRRGPVPFHEEMNMARAISRFSDEAAGAFLLAANAVGLLLCAALAFGR